MALANNSYDRAVWKRLLDFCSWETPWTRQLWRLGSVLELEELLEAAKATRALSEAAVRYLSAALVGRVKRDVGLGDARHRGILAGYVARDLTLDSHNAHALHIQLDRIKREYLSNWAGEVRRNSPNPEVVARAVSAHVLDSGLSPTALHRWLTYHGEYSPDRVEVADLIEKASELITRADIALQVLVPLEAAPAIPSDSDPSWLDASEASTWLTDNFAGQPHPRQTGAILLNVNARDRDSAIEKVAEEVNRLGARFRVGARQKLEFHERLYIVGEGPVAYKQQPRRVEMHSLQRTNVIWKRDIRRELDSALELLEPLDVGAPAAAVAGSWAAMESLFVGPGDKDRGVVVSQRMARVVACSYVRSELTSLANAYATDGNDAFATRLRDEGMTNVEKALEFENALRNRVNLNFRRTRHKSALERMADLVGAPDVILPRVVGQLEDAFRRLYRQRNFVLHKGDLTSVALRGTLRTVSPLVGAGIDKLVHASAVTGASPIQLAAIAEVNLDRVAEADSCLVKLLN